MSVGPVHLILGEDSFLAERIRQSLVLAVREELPAGAELEVTTLRGSYVTVPELIDATSPSLFGEDRVVVFTRMELAGKEPTEILLKACRDVAPGIHLVIQHTGGGRQKAMVAKFRKLAQVHEANPLKPRDRPAWVTNEFRTHGVRPTPDVVHALLEGVGSDLRELASAVSQLVSDTNGEVTVATVRSYYEGVAEVSGFDIADLAVNGQTARAVASTRRALQLGMNPVALAAALSSKVGAIARLYSTRTSDYRSLAGSLGMHPFVVEKTAKVARRWSGDDVSKAVMVVAELNAEVKGQGGDPEFAIEYAVRQISELAR
ncbi:DNA polymerase III subunit delta [Corynebacterium alimapuense]|uniref:DNA-directed DNA polymerase n=1 Tax=Corynebacterium alimapuense TaxID=1576874 RepID=A0A3M8K8R3_9CORY|nr:DNA polymerase III subunit delta [Corynebacterium alimapuense]RNE49623.1 DNA polymerase III subunit delta [Corynebacterium alimapuense]